MATTSSEQLEQDIFDMLSYKMVIVLKQEIKEDFIAIKNDEVNCFGVSFFVSIKALFVLWKKNA